MTVSWYSCSGPAVAAPVEERVDDDRQHVVPEAVLVVERLGLVELVGEQRLVAVHLPVDRLGVGVEQQLRRVAAVAVLGLVGPVHPVAVALPRLDAGQVGVVHEGVGLDHLHAGLGAGVVDQAELDGVGDLAEEREVDSCPVVRRTQRVRASWPDLHAAPSRNDGSRTADVRRGVVPGAPETYLPHMSGRCRRQNDGIRTFSGGHSRGSMGPWPLRRLTPGPDRSSPPSTSSPTSSWRTGWRARLRPPTPTG